MGLACGALHDGATCLAWRQKEVNNARQRLLAIPSKIAGRLPPAVDRALIEGLIEEEVYAALNELSGPKNKVYA